MRETATSVHAEIVRLRGDTAQNHERLMELCGKHPKAEGSVSIEHGLNRCDLRFVYPDGSSVSFNQKEAARRYVGLPPHVPTHRSDVLRAMRHAIAADICEYRLEHNVCCTEHVDHHYELAPFKRLSEDWVMENGGYPKILVEKRLSPYGYIWEWLKVPEQLQSWLKFHKEHAILRAIPAEENIKGRREYA